MGFVVLEIARTATAPREHSGDCVLHEQIVILFPSSDVLSKQQGLRLKDQLLCRGYLACSLK